MRELVSRKASGTTDRQSRFDRRERCLGVLYESGTLLQLPSPGGADGGFNAGAVDRHDRESSDSRRRFDCQDQRGGCARSKGAPRRSRPSARGRRLHYFQDSSHDRRATWHHACSTLTTISGRLSCRPHFRREPCGNRRQPCRMSDISSRHVGVTRRQCLREDSDREFFRRSFFLPASV